MNLSVEINSKTRTQKWSSTSTRHFLYKIQSPFPSVPSVLSLPAHGSLSDLWEVRELFLCFYLFNQVMMISHGTIKTVEHRPVAVGLKNRKGLLDYTKKKNCF